MPSTSNIDLCTVPLKALGQDNLRCLSLQLNAMKIILNDDGLQRDWRGLAQKVGIPAQDISAMSFLQDPFSQVLQHWPRLPSSAQLEEPNIGTLQRLLGELDRWDIFYDTEELFERDAESYIANLERSRTVNPEPESAYAALTQDDLNRQEQNLTPQMYDALLLYSETPQDMSRAKTMLDELESRKIKVCVKERDLLPGAFEYAATLELIADRCNRVIVIFSEAFLQTNLNKFLVSYAQSIGIERNTRKVIPVIYENCTLPSHMNYNFRLKYADNNTLYNFYDKLYDSVRPRNLPIQNNPAQTLGAIPRNTTVNTTLNNSTSKSTSVLKSTETEPSSSDTTFLCEQPNSVEIKKRDQEESKNIDTGYISGPIEPTESPKSKSLFSMINSKWKAKKEKKNKKTKVALEVPS